MPEHEWMRRRQRALHMTIRDIDVADFDVADTIARFKRWGVSLFSFFAGGYVTTYPTSLPWQRMSPQLKGRDLCGEILQAAHGAGIRTFCMIDLGEIPLEQARAHADWAARQADDSFYVKSDGIVTACPLSPYVRECSIQLVEELVKRYGGLFDGIKWGGASYGFPPGVCHCPTCRKTYRDETGRDLPGEVRDPQYQAWREDKKRESVRYLVDVVHRVADIPVMGNSVWHLGRGMDIDEMARTQDFVQVEVQTRTNFGDDDAEVSWERFSTPIETTRYVSNLTRRPPWVVGSYFLAWPWRQVAVPWPEQKVYLAQVAANGGSPMVNLTTGSPKHHLDPRGFRAIEELYSFMAAHADCYDGDASAATVALVYDAASATRARRRGRTFKDYLAELHGCEDALDRLHVPYDIVPSDTIGGAGCERYAAFCVPNAAALGDEACAALAARVKSGAGLVVTGAPGTRGADDGTRASALAGLLGVGDIGPEPQPLSRGEHVGPTQAYARLDAGRGGHEVLAGIEAPLLALAGFYHAVTPAAEGTVLLRRAAPFRVFPEGLSFPDAPDPAEPLAVVSEAAGGRTVYLPFTLGRCIARVSHPDNDRLLANALTWAARGRVAAQLAGFTDVRLSVRRQPGRVLVHLVNTTGRARYMTELVPRHELTVRVACAARPEAAQLVAAGQAAQVNWRDGWAEVRVPRLVDYEIIALEVNAAGRQQDAG